MSVSSIFSSLSASSSVNQLYTPTGTTAAGITSATDSDSNGSTATSVSGKAKLLQQLQQLSQTNPAEFKKVTADIAAQLQAQAKQDGGQQGQALTALASKFQQASQTGSLSALEPQRHHGHHHGSGGSSSASSSGTSSASSTAAAAYQQSGAQSAGSQISAIISQVLTQDLGSAAAGTATTAAAG